MDEGRTRLRDRMLRDAIVEVLRGVAARSGDGDRGSVVELGLVRAVTVAGSSVRIELVLRSGWRPFATDLAAEVQRRVDALPEVARAEVEVYTSERAGPARVIVTGSVRGGRRRR